MRRLLLLALLALPVFGQSDETPTEHAWNLPVKPFRIVGSVYYVGVHEVTSFLITTPAGHILIDGGMQRSAGRIEESIQRLGFRVRDVKILLSSHAHFDHAGGLAGLKRDTGAKLYAGAGDVAELARGGTGDPQFGDKYPFPPVDADRALHDGDRITLGGVTVIAHATPGHTRGCTTYSLHTAGHDVVFVGSPTAPDGYRLVGNAAYPDIVADYRREFAVLKSLRCDVMLGSHAGFFHLAEKQKTRRFVDASEYPQFVARMEKEFEKRLASQTSASAPSSE